MRLIHKKYEAALGWNGSEIIERRLEARSLSIIFGYNEKFKVLEDVTKIIVVDLLKKMCDCGE